MMKNDHWVIGGRPHALPRRRTADLRAVSDRPFIRVLAQVRRHTDVFSTSRGDWQPRSETAYYVCTRKLLA